MWIGANILHELGVWLCIDCWWRLLDFAAEAACLPLPEAATLPKTQPAETIWWALRCWVKKKKKKKWQFLARYNDERRREFGYKDTHKKDMNYASFHSNKRHIQFHLLPIGIALSGWIELVPTTQIAVFGIANSSLSQHLITTLNRSLNQMNMYI